MIALSVNGAAHELEQDPSLPLLYLLRDHLHLTGTKYGCGIGACGACTVLLDGVPVRSCSVTLGELDRATILTIESIEDSEWEAVQRAWIEKQVPQCGYCQSGMIMATVGLLREHPHPTPARISSALTNLCRCGTYPRIESAVLLAADYLAEWRKTQQAKPPRPRRKRRNG
jgi:isoquinoline 1-oxidoreductase alpha subunit